MSVTVGDRINRFGDWAQRVYVGEKYTWTISGVLWNNVKERCTIGGTTQTREPTYVGVENKFKDFQEFVLWHQKQIGYGLGYQLDADMLSNGIKVYSPETCLLLPASLNKFLQTSNGKRGDWPQGICINNRGKFEVAIAKVRIAILDFSKENLDVARALYKSAKEGRAKQWAEKLQTEGYEVDSRVIHYLNNYKHICDWTGNDIFSN